MMDFVSFHVLKATWIFLCAAAWEPTWLALGHALRRQRRYDDAAEALHTALQLAPGRGATRTALAFTLQLQVSGSVF